MNFRKSETHQRSGERGVGAPVLEDLPIQFKSALRDSGREAVNTVIVKETRHGDSIYGISEGEDVPLFI